MLRDFIVYKVLVRSLLSSVVPISLYALTFLGLGFRQEPRGFCFFDQRAWLVIFGLSILYPINQLSLWCLFRPIEKALISSAKKGSPPKERNRFLMGNFAPVHEELQYKVTEIKAGEVPRDLSGVYLKNGPNPIYEPEDGCYHWFSGEGMLHAFIFKEGQLFYCNRQTETPRVKILKKAGRDVFGNFGVMKGLGILLMPLKEFQRAIGYHSSPLEDLKGEAANTALIHHSQRTYALVESDLPFWVKVVNPAKDTYDIEGMGFDDYGGKLQHQVSAHPRVDRRTGEFFAFAYSSMTPEAFLSVFDSKRQLLSKMTIPVTCPRMLHDFQITEHYAIIPDLPADIIPERSIKEGKFIVDYNEKGTTRYGIIDRYSSDPSSIKWFPTKTHYIFHYANSWEEVNESGETIVVVHGCKYDNIDMEISPDINEQTVEKLKTGKETPSDLVRYEFNMTTGESREEILLKGKSGEFPIVNQDFIGYRNRWMYMPFEDLSKADDSRGAMENRLFSSLLKYDLEEKQIVGEVSFGECCTAGEVFFQKRDGADPEDEDDGYLMTTVHDWRSNSSQLVVWDAKTFAECQDPVLRAQLKQRVPNGFHSYFVEQSQM